MINSLWTGGMLLIKLCVHVWKEEKAQEITINYLEKI